MFKGKITHDNASCLDVDQERSENGLDGVSIVCYPCLTPLPEPVAVWTRIQIQRLKLKTAPASPPLFRFSPVSADNGFRMKGYWIWCPSIIRASDGMWHMFASRWPQTLPFHPGWLVASEIVRAVAHHPEGPYTFAEVIFPARGPEYWDGRSTHNPTIRFHAGKYYLFYMGSTHPLADYHPGEILSPREPRCIAAQSMKRIGLAWADSLEGPWHRSDAPLLPTRPGTFYSFLTSNPAPVFHEDGKVTLVFKARAYRGDSMGPMEIGVAQATKAEGPYKVHPEPIFSANRYGEIEDPFLWREGSGFKMIAKDMTGHLCGQAGAGTALHSSDAIHWKVSDPATAYFRRIDWKDGGFSEGSMERPFLLVGENGKPSHLCAAISNGTNAFSNATETRDVVLPLNTDD
jgi:hypothetical protein